jgi:hypothetical protein
MMNNTATMWSTSKLLIQTNVICRRIFNVDQSPVKIAVGPKANTNTHKKGCLLVVCDFYQIAMLDRSLGQHHNTI